MTTSLALERLDDLREEIGSLRKSIEEESEIVELGGLWEGIEIEDEDIEDAKDSLFEEAR
ncbi:MAG: hypothetical protein ABEJ56_03415 [Candidatus Nanohaloarchaea archaeon]